MLEAGVLEEASPQPRGLPLATLYRLAPGTTSFTPHPVDGAWAAQSCHRAHPYMSTRCPDRGCLASVGIRVSSPCLTGMVPCAVKHTQTHTQCRAAHPVSKAIVREAWWKGHRSGVGGWDARAGWGRSCCVSSRLCASGPGGAGNPASPLLSREVGRFFGSEVSLGSLSLSGSPQPS